MSTIQLGPNDSPASSSSSSDYEIMFIQNGVVWGAKVNGSYFLFLFFWRLKKVAIQIRRKEGERRKNKFTTIGVVGYIHYYEFKVRFSFLLRSIFSSDERCATLATVETIVVSGDSNTMHTHTRRTAVRRCFNAILKLPLVITFCCYPLQSYSSLLFFFPRIYFYYRICMATRNSCAHISELIFVQF